MNITETISLLDELRGRTTQGEWDWRHGDNGIDIVTEKEGTKFATFFKVDRLNNVEYIIALHNALPALRQAALDGERYRKAGETLAKSIEGFEVTPIACGSEEAQYSMNFLLAQIERHLKKISAAYRQALEQKDV